MVKSKKGGGVEFILPDPEPEPIEAIQEEDDFIDAPYTSILMSKASGDGCVQHSTTKRCVPRGASFACDHR